MTASKANDKTSGKLSHGADNGNVKSAAGKRGDWFKWLLVATTLIGGVAGNFFLLGNPDQSGWYLAGLWLVVVAIAASIGAWTSSGKQLIQFFKDARLELRKVVWPTRQETLQATLMVLVAVVVMSILLWVIDLILFRIINFLTT